MPCSCGGGEGLYSGGAEALAALTSEPFAKAHFVFFQDVWFFSKPFRGDD